MGQRNHTEITEAARQLALRNLPHDAIEITGLARVIFAAGCGDGSIRAARLKNRKGIQYDMMILCRQN